MSPEYTFLYCLFLMTTIYRRHDYSEYMYFHCLFLMTKDLSHTELRCIPSLPVVVVCQIVVREHKKIWIFLGRLYSFNYWIDHLVAHLSKARRPRFMGTMSESTIHFQDEEEAAVTAPTSLLVIGAATSRTGNLSTMLALERLGHKVFRGHHFLSHSRWPTLFSALAVAERQGWNSDEAVQAIVDELSQDWFTATLDIPMAAIWQDLYQHYPNATVLLTHRDNDLEAWAHSCLWIGFWLGYYLMQPPFCWIPPILHMVEI